MGAITWQYPAAGALAVVWLLLLVRRLDPPFRQRQRTSQNAQVPVWVSIIGWLLIAALVAAAAGGGLLWLLGWPQLPKQAAFSTTEMLDLLKIGLAVVAGFGGVVALAVNYRKQRVTEAAHAHSLNQEERERTKLFNERFKVAAELLGNDEVRLRIAGVSAMAGLADDWETQRQMCVDTLIDTLKLPKDDHDAEVANKIFRALRDRLGTPLRVGLWSPLNFDFSGLKFDEADFSERTFEGEVIFDGAEFTGQHTSFERTAFRNLLSCHGTRFTGTTANFSDALFTKDAQFVGCSADDSTLDFRRAELKGRALYFYRSELKRTQLIWRDTTLNTGAVRIERCEVTDCVLDFGDVRGATAERRSLGFLFIDMSKLTRCLVLLEPLDAEYQRVWIRDSPLEEVDLLTGEDDAPPPWLKIRGGEQEELPTT
ncbi:pentapeptide repeat-containing protein [Lentzea sp. NPDC102401]|uniref:pentapeptide repeat-containing protein n=1 Tax=Lentzea sp. NPDC102401 TaxID=3364128 RepID=UPI0037F3C796